MARQLSTLVAPPLCAICGSRCETEAVLCPGCEAGEGRSVALVQEGPAGVDLVISAARFEGSARLLVHGLKYARRLALARVAAAAMLEAVPRAELTGQVVPVPAGGWRWRWRGFDPAEEIAIALADLGGLPLSACLRRARGPRQVGRRRSERLGDPPRVWATGAAPAHALLADDVWTTGATLSACAMALRTAGCGRVVAVTLAHAL